MNIAELHKQGTTFTTQDGRPVRILCTDKRNNDLRVIVGLITDPTTATEVLKTWTSEGMALLAGDDLKPAQRLEKAAEHWATINPGAADQYRCEAHAARDALGFGKDDPHVAPIDLRKAVDELKTGSGGGSLALRRVLHNRPNPDDRDLLSEYTRWLNDYVEPAMRSTREAAYRAETRLRQEGYTAAMVVALSHAKPESDEYWRLVGTVGGTNRLWAAASQLGDDIYDYDILPTPDDGGTLDA